LNSIGIKEFPSYGVQTKEPSIFLCPVKPVRVPLYRAKRNVYRVWQQNLLGNAYLRILRILNFWRGPENDGNG
jgi:hypothetical protein